MVFVSYSFLCTHLVQTYGAVSSFSTSVVSQLGRLAVRLTEEELGLLSLTELSSISALGAIGDWSTRQVGVSLNSGTGCFCSSCRVAA